MATQRTFGEFMSICEAVYGGVKKEPKDTRLTVTAADKKANTKAWQNYKAGDKRYKAASHLGEDNEIDEKFSMAADTSKPQSPKPTKLPRSRERNVGRHDDWKDKQTEWGERPAAGKKLKSRANVVVQSQHRQDVETGVRKEEALDEVVVTRQQEVKQRAKNIKKIRDKKETLAALQQHAKLQKQGLVDEVEYDGENVDEVLMVTPSVNKTTKKVVKSASKLEKPDPRDPDYVTKQRAYVKALQNQKEAIDYERMSSGARAATERAAAAKKAKLQRQQSDAEAARSAFRTKGVPFSDAKGSGHIVNGKKVYAS